MTEKSTFSPPVDADNEPESEKASIEVIHQTTNQGLIEANYCYAIECLFCNNADTDDMEYKEHRNYVKCKKFGVYVNCCGICSEFDDS